MTSEAPHTPWVEKVVIVPARNLEPGRAVNVSACLAAGLAGACPGWAGAELQDADGLRSVASAHLPIVMLAADTDALGALLRRLTAVQGCPGAVCLFPVYAQSVHDAPSYWKQHRETAHAQEALHGLGLAGPKQWINSLTGSLPMFR